MVESKYADPELDDVLADRDNRICIDCRKEQSQWASLNNAVFLCIACAGIHRSLGVSVSYVRSLAMDNWDKSQIKLLKLGGNKKFNDNLTSFRIDEDIPPEDKYLLKGVEYYRNKVLYIKAAQIPIK